MQLLLLLLVCWPKAVYAGLAMRSAAAPAALTEVVQQGQQLQLNAVSVLAGVEQGFGWGVGDRDTVLLTTDLGESWSLVNTGLGETQDWYDVHFSTYDLGWMVGSGGKVHLHSSHPLPSLPACLPLLLVVGQGAHIQRRFVLTPGHSQQWN
jgi:photosystem II stability/assembly factor-like uncharacterized protein